MLLGKRILAVIPARGGSKGIKLKNLLKLGNRTLIEWVAECVEGCKFLDYTAVSTDHPKIKEHAENAGGSRGWAAGPAASRLLRSGGQSARSPG